MRIDGARERELESGFDFVIVGSGAAGASAARVLADSGASVAVVEEGPAVARSEFTDKAFPSFRRLFRGMAAQAATGPAIIPVLQGRCLGGSTVVNSAIVWRLPEDAWRPWRDEHGLGEALPLAELHELWDLIERELRVSPTPPAIWGRFNALMDAGARRLNASAAPTRRYAADCRGSAQCLTGCPHGAKQSMAESYLPYAESKGATVLVDAEVERVELSGARAEGVLGRFNGPGRPRFRLRARRGVLLAASAVQTPLILAASGIDSPHLGRHFQAHPGCAMIGLFEEPIAMWRGATQGFDCDAWRESGRFKIETISLPPELVLARLPGAGRRWLESMREYPHAAIWAVQLRAWAEGSVRPGLFGPRLRYALGPRDLMNLRRGLRLTAELFFAAGAKAVLPGVYGLPERLVPGEAWRLEHAPEDPACYAMILAHLFGTARMSPRAAGGVVGPDFAVRGVDGLYVVDSSVFPTNIGVNPQHTIMAVAMLAARRLIGS